MPLGTLDRTPPPFFRQGASAATKLAFFAALALFLMVADARFKLVTPLRAALAVALLPVQRVLAVPLELVAGGSEYLQGLTQALAGERAARAALAAQSAKLASLEQQGADNRHLRALLELAPQLVVRSTPAQVLYEAADPFTRKVIIDGGATQGIESGAPVINERGVLGQVTRVYALTSEVTLLADKDAAIPVINVRTQQRAAAFGGGTGGTMELRFTSANADVRVGDQLQTGGLDGVYPAGLAVATVASVDRRVESGFARIVLTPAAQPDGVRFVLVLAPLATQLPARPEPADAGARDEGAAKSAAKSATKSTTRRGGKAAASGAAARAQ
ncbi:MAG: rod shape-determining protein MreC [Burkholderiales bacterium]|nr:rod shape-determining protein MreC [Burkholderiales bacterium]